MSSMILKGVINKFDIRSCVDDNATGKGQKAQFAQ